LQLRMITKKRGGIKRAAISHKERQPPSERMHRNKQKKKTHKQDALGEKKTSAAPN